MDDYFTPRRFRHNYLRLDRKTIDPPGHATELFTQWAIDYLNSRKDADGPWCLYLAYNAPHTPIQPPDEWLRRVRQRHPGLDLKRAKLVALIEHLDDGVGRVLAALRGNGQDRNTLILFTSDNGGQLSAGAHCGPLRGGKQDMFEGGIRVPMCAVWPGHIAPGSRSQAVALTMDFLPTLCEAAGVPIPDGLNGRSILPILLGQTPALPMRDLVWMRREGNMRYRGRDYYAYRHGDWKLLQNSPFEPYKLYNLRTDPRETTDLAGQQPKVLRELVRGLMRHIQEAGRVPWQKP